MNEHILALKAGLEACFTMQSAATAAWHEAAPEEPVCTEAVNIENLRNLILHEHLHNFTLWHVEDEARRTDVSDAFIAGCKRRIDALNQLRNNRIETVDSCIVDILTGHLPRGIVHRQNTETVGMTIDRASILALKIYHMDEETRRANVKPSHRDACTEKLQTLRKQREDLIRAVLELLDDYAAGVKSPAMYHQFKMYNDPALNPELYGRK